MNEVHFGGIRAELVHRPEDRWTSKSCKSPAAVTRRCARLAGGSVPRCQRDGIMVGLFFRSECILLGCNIPQLRIVLQKVLWGFLMFYGARLRVWSPSRRFGSCGSLGRSVFVRWRCGCIVWACRPLIFRDGGVLVSACPGGFRCVFCSGFAADCRVCRLWGLCLLKNRA